jgi:hypothetical protein
MASKKQSEATMPKTGAVGLCKIADHENLTPEEVFGILVGRVSVEIESITSMGKEVPFDVKFPKGFDVSQKSWQPEEEATLAIQLYEALIPAKKASLGNVLDPGVWAWIGITQLSDYVVNRWCGGWNKDGSPKELEKCKYFLTGLGNHDQTRCAVRRLFIAADTSWRVDNTFDHVLPFLKSADLYSSIFERNLSLDPELAVEIVTQYSGLERKKYRPAIKLIGLILSTVTLELLNRKEKAQIVSDALQESSLGLVKA